MKQNSLRREATFQFLFHLELPINSEQRRTLIENTSETLNNHWNNFKSGVQDTIKIEDEKTLLSTIKSLLGQHSKLEDIITKYSKKWKNERISRVNYTVLLLAVHELNNSPNTPPKVVINEAIELSKKYGDKNSKDFINGLLDNYYKEEII